MPTAAQFSHYRHIVEQTTLRFVTVEIETAYTFALLAQSDYNRGDRESGNRTNAEARRACAVARRHVQRARNHGADTEVLEEMLLKLDELLDQLTS